MTAVSERFRDGSRSDVRLAKAVLFELQVEQHLHDETYHREIARLPLHGRLNHMALHFAKYAGKVAANKDPAVIIRVYVDTFIIALSTANILNLELWELVKVGDHEFPSLLTFGRTLGSSMANEITYPAIIRETAIATGQIAAACEKIDHLEEISFRKEISQGIARLSNLSLAFIALQGVEPAQAVRERLAGVKQRLKLHGRV